MDSPSSEGSEPVVLVRAVVDIKSRVEEYQNRLQTCVEHLEVASTSPLSRPGQGAKGGYDQSLAHQSGVQVPPAVDRLRGSGLASTPDDSPGQWHSSHANPLFDDEGDRSRAASVSAVPLKPLQKEDERGYTAHALQSEDYEGGSVPPLQVDADYDTGSETEHDYQRASRAARGVGPGQGPVGSGTSTPGRVTVGSALQQLKSNLSGQVQTSLSGLDVPTHGEQLRSKYSKAITDSVQKRLLGRAEMFHSVGSLDSPIQTDTESVGGGRNGSTGSIDVMSAFGSRRGLGGDSGAPDGATGPGSRGPASSSAKRSVLASMPPGSESGRTAKRLSYGGDQAGGGGSDVASTKPAEEGRSLADLFTEHSQQQRGGSGPTTSAGTAEGAGRSSDACGLGWRFEAGDSGSMQLSFGRQEASSSSGSQQAAGFRFGEGPGASSADNRSSGPFGSSGAFGAGQAGVATADSSAIGWRPNALTAASTPVAAPVGFVPPPGVLGGAAGSAAPAAAGFMPSPQQPLPQLPPQQQQQKQQLSLGFSPVKAFLAGAVGDASDEEVASPMLGVQSSKGASNGVVGAPAAAAGAPLVPAVFSFGINSRVFTSADPGDENAPQGSRAPANDGQGASVGWRIAPLSELESSAYSVDLSELGGTGLRSSGAADADSNRPISALGWEPPAFAPLPTQPSMTARAASEAGTHDGRDAAGQGSKPSSTPPSARSSEHGRGPAEALDQLPWADSASNSSRRSNSGGGSEAGAPSGGLQAGPFGSKAPAPGRTAPPPLAPVPFAGPGPVSPVEPAAPAYRALSAVKAAELERMDSDKALAPGEEEFFAPSFSVHVSDRDEAPGEQSVHARRVSEPSAPSSSPLSRTELSEAAPTDIAFPPHRSTSPVVSRTSSIRSTHSVHSTRSAHAGGERPAVVVPAAGRMLSPSTSRGPSVGGSLSGGAASGVSITITDADITRTGGVVPALLEIVRDRFRQKGYTNLAHFAGSPHGAHPPSGHDAQTAATALGGETLAERILARVDTFHTQRRGRQSEDLAAALMSIADAVDGGSRTSDDGARSLGVKRTATPTAGDQPAPPASAQAAFQAHQQQLQQNKAAASAAADASTGMRSSKPFPSPGPAQGLYSSGVPMSPTGTQPPILQLPPALRPEAREQQPNKQAAAAANATKAQQGPAVPGSTSAAASTLLGAASAPAGNAPADAVPATATIASTSRPAAQNLAAVAAASRSPSPSTDRMEQCTQTPPLPTPSRSSSMQVASQLGTARDYFLSTTVPVTATATSHARSKDDLTLHTDAPAVRTAADFFRGAASRATLNTSAWATPAGSSMPLTSTTSAGGASTRLAVDASSQRTSSRTARELMYLNITPARTRRQSAASGRPSMNGVVGNRGLGSSGRRSSTGGDRSRVVIDDEPVDMATFSNRTLPYQGGRRSATVVPGVSPTMHQASGMAGAMPPMEQLAAATALLPAGDTRSLTRQMLMHLAHMGPSRHPFETTDEEAEEQRARAAARRHRTSAGQGPPRRSLGTINSDGEPLDPRMAPVEESPFVTSRPEGPQLHARFERDEDTDDQLPRGPGSRGRASGVLRATVGTASSSGGVRVSKQLAVVLAREEGLLGPSNISPATAAAPGDAILVPPLSLDAPDMPEPGGGDGASLGEHVSLQLPHETFFIDSPRQQQDRARSQGQAAAPDPAREQASRRPQGSAVSGAGKRAFLGAAAEGQGSSRLGNTSLTPGPLGRGAQLSAWQEDDLYSEGNTGAPVRGTGGHRPGAGTAAERRPGSARSGQQQQRQAQRRRSHTTTTTASMDDTSDEEDDAVLVQSQAATAHSSILRGPKSGRESGAVAGRSQLRSTLKQPQRKAAAYDDEGDMEADRADDMGDLDLDMSGVSRGVLSASSAGTSVLSQQQMAAARAHRSVSEANSAKRIRSSALHLPGEGADEDEEDEEYGEDGDWVDSRQPARWQRGDRRKEGAAGTGREHGLEAPETERLRSVTAFADVSMATTAMGGRKAAAGKKQSWATDRTAVFAKDGEGSDGGSVELEDDVAGGRGYPPARDVRGRAAAPRSGGRTPGEAHASPATATRSHAGASSEDGDVQELDVSPPRAARRHCAKAGIDPRKSTVAVPPAAGDAEPIVPSPGAVTPNGSRVRQSLQRLLELKAAGAIPASPRGTDPPGAAAPGGQRSGPAPHGAPVRAQDPSSRSPSVAATAGGTSAADVADREALLGRRQQQQQGRGPAPSSAAPAAVGNSRAAARPAGQRPVALIWRDTHGQRDADDAGVSDSDLPPADVGELASPHYTQDMAEEEYGWDADTGDADVDMAGMTPGSRRRLQQTAALSPHGGAGAAAGRRQRPKPAPQLPYDPQEVPTAGVEDTSASYTRELEQQELVDVVSQLAGQLAAVAGRQGTATRPAAHSSLAAGAGAGVADGDGAAAPPAGVESEVSFSAPPVQQVQAPAPVARPAVTPPAPAQRTSLRFRSAPGAVGSTASVAGPATAAVAAALGAGPVDVAAAAAPASASGLPSDLSSVLQQALAASGSPVLAQAVLASPDFNKALSDLLRGFTPASDPVVQLQPAAATPAAQAAPSPPGASTPLEPQRRSSPHESAGTPLSTSPSRSPGGQHTPDAELRRLLLSAWSRWYLARAESAGGSSAGGSDESGGSELEAEAAAHLKALAAIYANAGSQAWAGLPSSPAMQEAASRSRLHVAFTRWLGQARSSRQAAAAAAEAPSGMFGSENVAPPSRPPPSSSGGSSAGGAAQLAALAALGHGRHPLAAWAASRPLQLTTLSAQRHPIPSSDPASSTSSVSGAPTHPRYGSLTTGLLSGATAGFGPSRMSATPPAAASALAGLATRNPALNVATPTFSRPSGLRQPPAPQYPSLQQQPYVYPTQSAAVPMQPSTAIPLAAQLQTTSYVYQQQPRTPAAPQPQSYVPQSQYPHLASPLAQASSSPQPAVRITPAASPLAAGSRVAPTTVAPLQGQSARVHSAKQQQQQRVSSLESLVAQHLVDALGGGSDAVFLAGLGLATGGGLGPGGGVSAASVAGPLTADAFAQGSDGVSQQATTNGTSGRSTYSASQAKAGMAGAGDGAGGTVGSQAAAPRSLYATYTQAAAGGVHTSLGAVQYGRVRPESAGSGNSGGRASRPAPLTGSGVLFGAGLEGGSVLDNIRAPPPSAGIDLQFYGVSKR